MKPQRAVEKYYTPNELALLLSVHPKTVIKKMRAGEFGNGVINVATPVRLDVNTPVKPDYRIPASGINEYVERSHVFTEPGIAARSIGELRRKVAAQQRAEAEANHQEEAA